MNNPKFDGLYADPDPVASPHPVPRRGHSEETVGFTLQQSPVRRRDLHLRQYVTMVGGCYLFMPALSALRFLTDSEETHPPG